MKIKIIELLNMIANGDNLPKRIKYADSPFKERIYELNIGISVDYVCTEGLKEPDYLFSDHNVNILNDYIEILEDEDEDEIDIQNIRKFEKNIVEAVTALAYKCNEILETVQQLDKKIKNSTLYIKEE